MSPTPETVAARVHDMMPNASVIDVMRAWHDLTPAEQAAIPSPGELLLAYVHAGQAADAQQWCPETRTWR